MRKWQTAGLNHNEKLLLKDRNFTAYPIFIKYKGYNGKLAKLDSNGKIANKTAKNQPDFNNINSYGIGGAVHYSNA